MSEFSRQMRMTANGLVAVAIGVPALSLPLMVHTASSYFEFSWPDRWIDTAINWVPLLGVAAILTGQFVCLRMPKQSSARPYLLLAMATFAALFLVSLLNAARMLMGVGGPLLPEFMVAFLWLLFPLGLLFFSTWVRGLVKLLRDRRLNKWAGIAGLLAYACFGLLICGIITQATPYVEMGFFLCLAATTSARLYVVIRCRVAVLNYIQRTEDEYRIQEMLAHENGPPLAI